MSINDNQKIYSNKHILFFDNIIKKKRVEMTDVIKIFLKDKNIEDILDIGSTEDENNPSSNYIIKNLGNYKIYKSISDQLIKSNFFTYKLNKSITRDFSEQEREEILKYKGVQPIKINENILRSETAVISAISILNYELN